MELIERRAAWLTISVAIILVYDSTGAGIAYDSIPTWELIVFLAGIFSLGGAGVLLALSLAPAWFRRLELEQRERLVFFASVLLTLAIVAIVTLTAHAAIHAHQHPQG